MLVVVKEGERGCILGDVFTSLHTLGEGDETLKLTWECLALARDCYGKDREGGRRVLVSC